MPSGFGHHREHAPDELQRHIGGNRSLIEFTNTVRGALQR